MLRIILKHFNITAHQWQNLSTAASSPAVSPSDAFGRDSGRHNSVARDSGYGSSEIRRNSSSSVEEDSAVQSKRVNATRGRGKQSRKVQRQAERREQQRKKEFVPLRPATRDRLYSPHNDRYILRRHQLYAKLNKGRNMPWKAFVDDYNARFAHHQRSRASLAKRFQMLKKDRAGH